MRLDDPGRPLVVATGERVSEGVVGQLVLLVPVGGGAVQRGGPGGVLACQSGPQQVGEQVVVAPPPALAVERQQEQVRPLDGLQQQLAVTAPEDRVAQRPGQPVEHRALQQERPDVLGLPVQYLLGQVVQDVAVAAGELLDEPGDVATPLQRQRGQLQPGDPALGALAQRRDEILGQVVPRRRRQQLGRLAEREPQIGGAQLGQLPPRAQSGQRQRRVAAGGHHQPERRWAGGPEGTRRTDARAARGSGGSRPPPVRRPPWTRPGR